MQTFDEDTTLKLEGLLHPMFELVGKLLHLGQESEAREVLMDIHDLADHEARLFKSNFPKHLTMLLQVVNNVGVASNAGLDSETRQAALEVAITVVESRPMLIRKDAPRMQMLCQSLLECLLEIEDTPTWHTALEEEDLEDGTHGFPTAGHRLLLCSCSCGPTRI
jgi:hypothetical protein